jgi:hypothetical protein
MSDITKADRQRLADALRTATREELLDAAAFHAKLFGPVVIDSDPRESAILAALALAVVDQVDAAGRFDYQRWCVNKVGEVVRTNLNDGSDTLPSALADFITREGE